MEYKLLIKNKKGATGLSPFIKSLLLVIFISFCLISFAFNFIYQKNPTNEIFSSKYGMINNSISALTNSLNDFQTISNTAKEKLSKAEPTPLDFVFLIFYGAFEIPKLFLGFIWSGAVGISGLIAGLFGAGVGEVAGLSQSIGGLFAIAAGLILSTLLFTGIFLLIKAIRSGESER